MSVTSSPEPMELETGPPPSLLSEDVSAEWPIEEDPDIILRQFSYSRDETRAKILSLTSEDQLTIGENIRPHPAHSDEVLFTQTISIKSQAPVSLPPNTPFLPLLTSPRCAFSSLPSQQHRDTPSHTEPIDKVKINSLYKDTPHLNSNADPSQLHMDSHCERNSEISPTATSFNNKTGELESERVMNIEVEAPVDPSSPPVCRRVPSPVITNGTQHEVGSEAPQLKDKPPSLDTPPLSSSIPEDPVSDPFSTLSADTQVNGSTSQGINQLQEKEGESESESSQVEVSTEEHSTKISQVEIENKNPNYELETPPDDGTELQLPNPSAYAQSDVQTEVCSSPCEFHDCVQDPTTTELSPSQPELELDVEYSTTGEITLVSEIETFSISPPLAQIEDVTMVDTPLLPSSRLPPALQVSIENPRQDVCTRLHLQKCEDIICMQQTLRSRSKEIKEAIAEMEQKILIQQSHTLFSVSQNKQLSSCALVPLLTHSHLLKLTHTRESEKQARMLKAGIKNCKDRMNTGCETESSSEDECYLNSTNLGGPKRRRLTKLHRFWLNDRAEIGGRWNWLDLQIAQIDNEIASVNQRLEDIQVQSSQEDPLPLDTASRCTPYTPSNPSRVIHQSVSINLGSLNNILQSTPHHHSILSLRDDIPSTLLMYDATMGLGTKDLPLDPKDLKKLEFTISHNKSSPAIQSRYKAMRGTGKKIGHRPKLNNSHPQSSRYRHVSIAEISQNKPGKSKPLLHGGSRQRRARSYDTTSIIIPGSCLPKPEKHSYKEIIIPGWRPVEGLQKVDTDIYVEDTSDVSYEAMHSKCEELEIRNYQDALHYSASSKRLKRHQANVDIQKVSSPSYGWSSRRFPLSSEDRLDEGTSHLSKPTGPNSPMEDAVFSTPHITSHSYKSQQ